MKSKVNKTNECNSAHSFTIALVVLTGLSLLAIPIAVQASPYDKAVSTFSDPAYLSLSNGVFQSNFARNVPGIQSATHIVALGPEGLPVGGWI